MTTYGAYDAGLPCKNPNCKSHGTPHPNCKCYGNMAKGGEAGFCGEARDHQADCEYFSSGGQVGFIPDDKFKPAEEPKDGFIPDSKFVEGKEKSDIPGFIPDDEFHSVDNKYETTGQQIATGIEGMAQGIAGPVATFAETKLLGIPAEDIVSRQQANPWIHRAGEATGFGGSMLLGTGEAGLVAKLADGVGEGSAFLKGAINSGIFSAGDEATKWMLGQGDPEDAVGSRIANVGIAALTGGILGRLGKSGSDIAKKGLEKISESKIGEKAQYILYGIASAAKNADRGGLSEAMEAMPESAKKAFQYGQKLFDKITISNAAAPMTAATFEGAQGYREGGIGGALKGAGKGFAEGVAFDIAKAIANPVIRKAGEKVIAPAVLKILSSGTVNGIFGALDHMAEASAGSKMINKSVERLFNSSPVAGEKILNEYHSERDRQKLDDYLDNGGLNQDVQDHTYDNNAVPAAEGFAEGGDVQKKEQHQPLALDNGVAIHYPEQNFVMNVAKGRVTNYLHGLKPNTEFSQKLAFDDHPDQRSQKKKYDRAMTIALSPLSVLDEIKKGTVDPEHVKHLNAMYPEVSQLLQKRITERIIQAQLKGEKPSHKVRQGLSMFMGTALSGELLPQNIQAAQAVFSAKQQQPANQPAQKTGSPSKLSKTDQSFLTGAQALQRRSQKV